MNQRSGSMRTNLSGELSYNSFVPAPLPQMPPMEMDSDMVDLLVRASKELVILDGISSRIPDVGLFISMYVRKEALLSSQIEGTQATLEDVLDPKLDENTNREVADVINYIRATDFAIQKLRELPLCSRLIRDAHYVLMQGVRGNEKEPGDFRHSQNWIGRSGCTLKDARYIPPNPEDMLEAMSDLEKYMNAEDTQDVLIRAGLIHYQFETIHPFLDGNGRIGRLLITLFFLQKGVLHKPSLYISYFLKKNRTEYYDRLSEVRDKGNYEQWIRFFLQALIESAQDAVLTIDQLSALHLRCTTEIAKMGRSAKSALRLFTYLEANPIIDMRKTANALNVSFNTVANAVDHLIQVGILEQAGNESRNRSYAFVEYLDILRKGT